jgi:hypothetical protein
MMDGHINNNKFADNATRIGGGFLAAWRYANLSYWIESEMYCANVPYWGVNIKQHADVPYFVVLVRSILKQWRFTGRGRLRMCFLPWSQGILAMLVLPMDALLTLTGYKQY